MCGRARLSSDVGEVKIAFSIPPERPAPNIRANWNMAPTQDGAVVRYDADEAERSLDVMRWGLVPFWAKDIKIGYSTFNAKAEGIDAKPVFREAFKRRRCLVPLDSFYEWKKVGKEKQPYDDHHDDAERALRRDPRPDAGHPQTGDLAGLACALG